ncbi:YigZ family protein [Sulfurovum sp.]|uniref:IMPACT family protein n=1 Tax=Sulfurovum sp. TaxID=1969726 RepID=UPI0025DFABE4|nr:YigZ family protein [Sulfurovum sp.]
MHTVEAHTVITTEVNRSKFIAYLVPIADYEGLQEKLKKEHSKANHVVYALRYLNEFDQVVENSSDDGEPKGCAGVPALNVMRGEALINCAVLIVRYFGGIKLGTGGMARAYALAVKEVLKVADMIVYEKEVVYAFVTDYSTIDKTLYTLKQCGIVQIERKFETNQVDWKIRASEEKVEQYKKEAALKR